MKYIFYISIFIVLLFSSCDQLGFSNLLPKPDTTPPRVMDSDPVANDEGFDPTNEIIIYFQEDLDKSTITTDNITLVEDSGSLINITVNFESSDNSLHISPETALEYYREYTVTLSNIITDTSGNALKESYILSFKTNFTVEFNEPEQMVYFNNPLFGYSANAEKSSINVDSLILNGADILPIPNEGDPISGSQAGINHIEINTSHTLAGTASSNVDYYFWNFPINVQEDFFNRYTLTNNDWTTDEEWISDPSNETDNEFHIVNNHLVNNGISTTTSEDETYSVIIQDNYSVMKGKRVVQQIEISYLNNGYESYGGLLFGSNNAGAFSQVMGAISPYFDEDNGDFLGYITAIIYTAKPDLISDPTDTFYFSTEFIEEEISEDNPLNLLFEMYNDQFTLIAYSATDNYIYSIIQQTISLDMTNPDSGFRAIAHDPINTPDGMLSIRMDNYTCQENY